MSRVEENKELLKIVECVDETLTGSDFADTLSLASIATYLSDISKSLAVIADALEEKK